MSTSNHKQNLTALLTENVGKTWFAALLLAILVIAVFSTFIFSDKMLITSDQMNGLDARVTMKQSITHSHQFPLWFSSRLGGMPTIDALFGDAFYPPSLLISLCSSVPRAIGYKMIFHIFLAGLFFFLMLRKGFGINPLVSFTGAAFYMLNPQFVSHIYPGHDGKMFVIAWVPFIIWQLKTLLSTPKLLTATFLGLGIGMCILTSHIQLTYFVLWGTGLYWITASAIIISKKDYTKVITVGGYFWGAVLIGIGIGSIQIFPSFLYIRDAFSVRGADRGFDFASSWSLHWPEFFSMWVPEFVNSLDYYWGKNPFKLNSEYAGMMPVLLSIGAIILKPKNPWRIFWGIVALIALLFALGANTPVFHIAYALVPYVKKFRAASMVMFWFSFSTILLSALFLKDMASGIFSNFTDDKKAAWSKGILIACGICIGISIIFSLEGFVKGVFSGALDDQRKIQLFEINFSRNFIPFLWVWCMLTVIVLALIYAHIKNKASPTLCISVILVLGLIDILRVDSGFIKLTSPAPYFNRDPALNPLIDEMKSTPFRCFALPGALPQNGEGIHGLEGIAGFHDNELHWYREFRGDQQNKNYLASLVGITAEGQPYLRAEKLSAGNPFLNIANVHYLLVRNGTRLMTVRNDNALDRISFVPDFIVMDSSKVPEALSTNSYDYRRMVALTVTPELPNGFSKPPEMALPPTPSVSAIWKRYTPNKRTAEITVPAPGFLRIAEVFYPGWTIKIDGITVPYYRADLAWMAVPVTGGNHLIELEPGSTYLDRFIPVFCGTLFLLAVFWGMAIFSCVKHRKLTT